MDREYLHFDCAHAPQHLADFRRIVNGRWLWLCKAHSEFHAVQEAKAYCAERGLLTTDQMREWIKKHPPMRGRMHGPFLDRYRADSERAERRTTFVRDRIPGEDDEPLMEEIDETPTW